MRIKSIIGATCTYLAVASFNVSAATVEWEVVELINQERTAVGLSTLDMDARLLEAARFHSEDMLINNIFQHDSSDGTNTFVRLGSFDYSCGICGEVIAKGPTAADVVAAWVASPAHLDILLNSSFKGIGVGWADNYWTVDFGAADVDQVPIPSAVWLFSTGLLGLIGFARRKVSS